MSNRGFFLQQKDSETIWHPFDRPGQQNIVIKKARGVYLYDTQNRKYLDAVSSWWVNVHGHGQRALKNALNKQFGKADHIIFSGFTHEPAIRLADLLLKKFPNAFDKVFFSDNGSTAVEVALKLAIQYYVQRGAKKITLLAFDSAYHGDTFGAMSVGARSVFTKAFEQLMFEVKHVPLPHAENIENIKKSITQTGQSCDALIFIYEPLVQGAGGMNVYELQHLEAVLESVRQFESLCIADEVMTGFYRTGSFTASEKVQQKLFPDLLCLSKGITGGVMPLGATLIHEKLVKWFSEREKPEWFYHGHSYTGNPLACAVAVENMKLFDNKKLEQINLIEQMHRQFAQRIEKFPNVKNVKVCGTIFRFELALAEDTGYTHSKRDIIYQHFLNKGILLRPLGNVLYFMPPYSITQKQLEFLYSQTEQFLQGL